MKIEDVVGVTEKKDIQIQKSCKAIGLVSTGAAVLAAANATLKLITKNGEKIIYDSCPILDLMEMMAQGEGLFIKDTLAAAVAYPGTLPVAGARTVGKLPVTSGIGSYILDDGEYFSLDLYNIAAGTTYRISALEDLESEEELHFVEKIAILAPRTSQEYNRAGADFIALPKTNLVKIQMFSDQPGGNNPTFEFEELMIEAIDNNDIVNLSGRTIATTPPVNLTDTIVGADNLIVLSLEGVRKFEIFCTGAAGYIFYRGKITAPEND